MAKLSTRVTTTTTFASMACIWLTTLAAELGVIIKRYIRNTLETRRRHGCTLAAFRVNTRSDERRVWPGCANSRARTSSRPSLSSSSSSDDKLATKLRVRMLARPAREIHDANRSNSGPENVARVRFVFSLRRVFCAAACGRTDERKDADTLAYRTNFIRACACDAQAQRVMHSILLQEALERG